MQLTSWHESSTWLQQLWCWFALPASPPWAGAFNWKAFAPAWCRGLFFSPRVLLRWSWSMGFIDRLWEHQTCIKSADAVKKIGRLGRFTAVLQLFCGQDKQLL